jgi:hypothetical protein
MASLPATAAAAPIPSDPAAGDLPQFEGRVATPRRLAAQEPPRHPFMAPNGRSNIHDDAFRSDSYWRAGPLGRDMQVTSTFQGADCASVTFDSRNRIVTVCVGLQGPRLFMMDPRSLDTLATMNLPPRIPGGGNVLTDFAGGGYFYLDNRDRAVIPTTTRHVYVVRANADPGFTLERDHDLTGGIPSGDKIISALPDWSGRLWYATTQGRVGIVGGGSPLNLGEEIQNSFAVDDTGGVYVVTDKALYRLAAGPRIAWRKVYGNSGIAKPGQVGAGSGTTPTVMSGGRVAITDNADPMNVVVYTARSGRKICEQPVFGKGASATDNSLVAARNSLVVENNYGYMLAATSRATAPRRGSSAWTSSAAAAAAGSGGAGRVRHRSCRSCRSRPVSSTRTPSRRGTTATTPGTSRPRLLHRAHGLQAPHRDRARLQQPLRAGHGRPRRQRLRGRDLRPDGRPRQPAAERAARLRPARLPPAAEAVAAAQVQARPRPPRTPLRPRPRPGDHQRPRPPRREARPVRRRPAQLRRPALAVQPLGRPRPARPPQQGAAGPRAGRDEGRPALASGAQVQSLSRALACGQWTPASCATGC